MKYNYLMILVTLFTSVFTGCTTYLAESSFNSENVQVSKRTESKQPYRIENVYCGVINDPIKYLELRENANKHWYIKLQGLLNGGVNYEENARIQKEAYQDAFETQKVYAANVFGVDEEEVSLAMVGFMRVFLLSKSEYELSEMGLPKYSYEGEIELTDEQRSMYSMMSSEVFRYWFGTTAADADMLNDYLSEQYPELFVENGKPINVAIIIVDAPVSKRGRYSSEEHHYFDFGVWVWGANKNAGANEIYPLPTSSFSAINRYNRTIVPFSFSGPLSDDTEFIKVKDKQEVESFMLKRFGASIVDALNNLSKEQFDKIR